LFKTDGVSTVFAHWLSLPSSFGFLSPIVSWFRQESSHRFRRLLRSAFQEPAARSASARTSFPCYEVKFMYVCFLF